MLEIADCPVCGQKPRKFDNCPGCGTRPRIRTLFPIMKEVVSPLAGDIPGIVGKPVLAFATTNAEKQQLGTCFPLQKSVSLYGNYGKDHEEGVDIRDLSRYPDGAFSGVFGVLLFDYFPEHEAALRESFRVLAPGGIFLTHIASSRLSDDDAPAKLDSMLVRKPGYMNYIPADKNLPSVHVGRKWFTAALAAAGFRAELHQVHDAASKQKYDWFLGIKPKT